MYEATLKLGSDLDLKKIFDLEDKVFSNGRASYDVIFKSEVIAIVKAADSVALRSVLNTITKIVTVFEKAKGVIENEKRD